MQDSSPTQTSPTSTPLAGLGADVFFQRARYEAQRYGEDPWVFLREMVQNSRDARATEIRVETRERNGQQYIICEDNGDGMSLEDLDRYLLRLYASSKEEESGSIGFFGVGFWSILLFNPATIQVSSSRDGQSRSIEINCETRTLRQIESNPPQQGTRIVLIRPKANSKLPSFAEKVRERLAYYAAHVRPFPGKDELALLFNGQAINQVFPNPTHMSKRFKNRRFDGVLGFDEAPSVRIYKGGILVRDLATLDEVIPKRPSEVAYSGWGFYPVIKLNIDRLQVLMDRKQVFEDKELYEAVAYCERMLIKAHAQLVRHLFPMNWMNQCLKFGSQLKGYRLWTLLVLVALLVLVFAFPIDLPQRPGAFLTTPSAGPQRASQVRMEVDQILNNWQGSLIDSTQTQEIAWDFSHSGNQSLLFRIGTLGIFDSVRGLLPESVQPNRTYPDFAEKAGPKVEVNMGVSSGGTYLALPLPPDHVVLAHSAFLDRDQLHLFQDRQGFPVVWVEKPGRLSYQIQAQAAEKPPLTYPSADIPWPEPYQSALSQTTGTPTSERVRQLTNLVTSELTYTRLPSVAESFKQNRAPWVAKVIQSGGGDCDILNGMLVMMMRAAGIPADLSIGVVTSQGKPRSALHAWARYFDGGWQTLDVTTAGYYSTEESPFPLPAQTPVAANESGGISTSQNASLAGERNYPSSLPWTIGALVMFSLLALYLWRRRSLGLPIGESGDVVKLVQHYFNQGLVRDPLGLKFRPVFLLAGSRKRVSLFQLEKAARHGPLLGTKSASPPPMSPHGFLLDLNDPFVRELRTVMPNLMELEQFHPHMAVPLPPFWREVERRIAKLDPRFRLHLMEGQGLEEMVLRPARNEGYTRHLFLGKDHPALRELTQLPDGEEKTFLALRFLIDRCTFYIHSKDEFLAQSAAGRIVP